MNRENSGAGVATQPENLQDDPMARAAYSGNPGFVEGAAEAHPISSAGKSLLAEPKVAEGLEAVYIRTSGNEATPADGLAPLNFSLAKSGLSWLKKNIDGDSERELRERVIETKSGLETMEYSEQLRAANKQRADEQTKRQQAQKDAAAKLAQAARAEEAREEAHQARYRAELDTTLAPIREEHPELDFDSFSGLCDELQVSAEKPPAPGSRGVRVDYGGSGGPGLYVMKKPGFQNKLAQRMADYADPGVLKKDLELRWRLQQSVYMEFTRNELTATGAYSSAVFSALHNTLDTAFLYPKDFSLEAVESWIEAIATDKSPSPIRPAIVAEISGYLEGPDNILNHTTGTYGKKILANSLEKIIHEQPEKFVDAAYMIAEAGLDPDDPAKRDAALAILGGIFAAEPLALDIFYAATVSRHEPLQRKAVDLGQTLMFIDPDISGRLLRNSTMEASAGRLSREDLRILRDIYNKYLKMNNRMLSNEETLEFDRRQVEHVAAFLDWIETPEGAGGTLYGRFSSEQRAA